MRIAIILILLFALTACSPKEVPPEENTPPEDAITVPQYTSEEYFVYEVSDGYAVISDYTGSDTEVNIPETINGLTVKKIGERAFYHHLEITKITIPDTVTYMSDGAFSDCTSLVEINFPEKLEGVGYAILDNTPFYDAITEEFFTVGDGILLLCNTKDENVIIPNGIKFIADAFCESKTVKLAVLPESVTHIGDYAFYNSSIESVKFSSAITIGNYAFYGCKNLTSIELPESLTQLGKYAFAKTSLESITIPNNISLIPDFAFADTPLKDIMLPDGIISIGDYAFRGCLETSLFLPDGLESIGRSMIENSENIKTVFFPPSVTYIGEGSFINCPNLVIYAEKDSPAETYAKENGIAFAIAG